MRKVGAFSPVGSRNDISFSLEFGSKFILKRNIMYHKLFKSLAERAIFSNNNVYVNGG